MKLNRLFRRTLGEVAPLADVLRQVEQRQSVVLEKLEKLEVTQQDGGMGAVVALVVRKVKDQLFAMAGDFSQSVVRQ